jgi:endopeptidase La
MRLTIIHVFDSHLLTLPDLWIQSVRNYSRKPAAANKSKIITETSEVTKETEIGNVAKDAKAPDATKITKNKSVQKAVKGAEVLDAVEAATLDIKPSAASVPVPNGISTQYVRKPSQEPSASRKSKTMTEASSGVPKETEIAELAKDTKSSVVVEGVKEELVETTVKAVKGVEVLSGAKAATLDIKPASGSEPEPTATNKTRQRLKVATRLSSTASKDNLSEQQVERGVRTAVSMLRLLDPKCPPPASSVMLITPNIHSLLSVPSHLSIDALNGEHISQLRSLTRAGLGIVLVYGQALPTVIDGVTQYGYFGMYCNINAITKHSTAPRCELTLCPLRRVKLKDGLVPKSFSIGDFQEWTYLPMEGPDMDDILVSALPLLPNPSHIPLRPTGMNHILVEMTLHRIAAQTLETLGRHDPSGVRHLIEQAFVERSLHIKLELLQKAVGMTTISHELTHSIEDLQERRKLQGVEQQMEKMIRQQLSDPEQDPELKLAAQIAQLPEHLRTIAQKEFDYMKSLDPSGQDHGVVSTYLDWFLNMPWTTTTKDRFDMAEAKSILDKSHHGLEDVKLKILQLMANASRTGKMSAKPLLFVGPPGTGKTSFAKAIADALGRKFISLAGLTETNDLRGHRRTYVGSIPGKIVSEMRRCGSKNPVIVIDEIDKIEDSQRHRPLTPALLELLSPDQNKRFFDQYLDTGIDCSEVLFICTANSQEAISSPLLNRLQVVELRAYSANEKFDIAKDYVLKQALEETGLKNVTMTDESIQTLVQIYSKHEAGVRQIRRHMQRIMRQLAVKAVTSQLPNPAEMTFEVNKEEMLKLLEAPELVRGDKIYDEALVGVVNGLSKNMYGGSTLTIETIADIHKAASSSASEESKSGAGTSGGGGGGGAHSPSSSRGVQFTGNIMDTMKESSSIAYTYAKSFLAHYFPDNDFFSKASLHVHVPFGQIRKDGPSAGCALVCSYLSVAFGRALPDTLCMTGEITLSGRVTAVGGIREKVTAAAQNGMTDVILPLQNKGDFDAIPKDLVNNIKPHFVSTYEEAFAIAFKGLEIKPQVNVASAPPIVPKRKIVTKTPIEQPTTKPRHQKLPTSNIIPDLEDKRSKIPLSAVPSL